MSNTLRTYRRIEKMSQNESEMSITAFCGGETGSVQFTIGSEYCCLSDVQLKDLISVLQKRMRCAKGYSATDYCEAPTIDEYGKKIHEV